MKAILPSAGYATRLYPLTLDKPKALLDVGGRPIIEYIIDKLCLIEDVDEILIVTNDKYYENFLEWEKDFECRVGIKVFNDGTRNNEERLGAIGDINFVLEKEKIDDDFIVINSDNLFSFDLVKIYEDFLRRGAPIVSMYDVGSLEIARRMGNPKIDSENKIVFFKEKDPNFQSSLCSVGIYLFDRESVGLFKKYLDGGQPYDRPGDFIAWLYKERDIYGYVFDGEENKWFDIGDIGSYEEAKRVWSG